jgi:predicted RNA-binding Zn ribbon-like protein
VPDEYPFDLSGGHLGLDFANTRGNAKGERLGSYARLVAFARQAGVLSDAAAAGLLEASERRAAEGAAALARAVGLRDALARLFLAAAGGDAPDPLAIEAVNRAFRELAARTRLAPGGARFEWQVAPDGGLAPMLDPILRASVDLLASPDLERVSRCEADDCWWLFLDASRTRRRRWCEMRSCGNRMKARRHRERRREAGEAG